ncbi:hypothetical protein EDC04DRAFT_2605908 [Pisolithus marmoratus]|nr:hypothetical protein EDC04DRAFT_2605908 [Pisolithus marmoratus]
MTQPIGTFITEFSCLGELLVAFLDYVIAHKNAVEITHILHHAISLVTSLLMEAQVELCGRIAKLKQQGADQFSDAGDPLTSPIEMVSQTANHIYMVPVSLQNAEPHLVSIPDLTRDHNIVMAMGPQFETESNLHHTIDMSPLYCTVHPVFPYFKPLIPLLTQLCNAVIIPLFFNDHGNITCRKPFTHDLFITSTIETLSHLGPDAGVPVDHVGNNKDLANPEVKVKDELNADGTKEASGAYKFTLSNLMSLPPMLLRPPLHQAAAGQGFYSMDMDWLLVTWLQRS